MIWTAPLTMHTYLPYANPKLNSAVLSETDLAQQIHAGLTILRTLNGDAKGWQWHPAIGMWEGSTSLLAQHILQLGREWGGQGFKDTFGVGQQMADMGFDLRYLNTMDVDKPWWWGEKAFHVAQRAALVRHDRPWYSQFIQTDGGKPELWPMQEPGKFKIGPQPSPDGTFNYLVDGRPMLRESCKMTDAEFLFHINTYHQLLGNKKPIKARDIDVLPMLRSLHDRFHSQRFYNSHDHVR